MVEKQKNLNNKSNHKVYLGGGKRSKVGDTVKTEPNTGALDNMTNQCFWISILQYLKKNGYEYLTLEHLRTNAGLDKNTQHTMFDSNFTVNGNALFINAAQKIANIYNLQIQIFSVTQNGKIIGPRAFFERENNNEANNQAKYVEIAQFGLRHFQLINENGEKFIPAIGTKDKFTWVNKDITEHNQQLLNAQLNLNDALGMAEVLYYELNKSNKDYNEQLKSIDKVKKLNSLKDGEKEIISKQYESELKYVKQNRKEIVEKLKILNNEISSLITILGDGDGES